MKSLKFASLAIVVVPLLFCSFVMAAAADDEKSNLSGSASIQYRYRSDGDNTDQDAMQSRYLSLCHDLPVASQVHAADHS